MMVGTERRPLPVRSDVDLMAVREATRSAAAAAGFSLVSQTKLVTAVSELARNAVVHGGGGEVRIEAAASRGARGVRLVISDTGPGIADIDQALTDGHTTGHGLGLGLGGARRLVDDFSIESAPGQGTTITIAMWAPSAAPISPASPAGGGRLADGGAGRPGGAGLAGGAGAAGSGLARGGGLAGLTGSAGPSGPTPAAGSAGAIRPLRPRVPSGP